MALIGTNLVGVGRQASLRVTLPAPAPTGGVSVEMLSDDTNLVTVGPPAVIGINAGASTADVVLNGINAGTTIVRAQSLGYTEGTLSVTVTQNILSVPPTLNVPFGSTTSIPVSIPTAAPAVVSPSIWRAALLPMWKC